MQHAELSADYVIAGAGAVGLAFADTLVAESSASVLIVDRRARPGGHWNDAYPFVRLHGPSATHGGNSLPRGTGRLDEIGSNRGLHELASGAEICAYFDRVMQERLLPSGRVTYLPLHDLDGGVATSLLDGGRRRVSARRRWIDATRADTQVPATHPPRFAVDPGVRCVTPTELTRPARPCRGHVIVGGGKTAMDTALWLLERGIDPDTITWIRPRDSWLLNRANVQPTAAFFARTLAAMAAEVEAMRGARSIADLFARLESAALLQRLDPAVQPTMYRCAVVSEAERDQLRRIRNVVRLGRVQAITADRIVLDHGAIPTSSEQVHVHCSAAGLPRGPAEPIFQGDRIVPQYVRRCSPSFSAALVAHVELTVESDDEKNALCEPMPPPREPLDWLRMHLASARNQQRWARRPELQEWLARSRLEAYSGLTAQAGRDPESTWRAPLARLREASGPGLQRLAELLAGAERSAAARAPSVIADDLAHQ
jgi:hypothetical protein